MTEPLHDGWYLMSTEDVERELARWREPERALPPSNAVRLEVDEALSYRNAGNLPDEHGRSLRLVLRIEDANDLANLEARRRVFEPDYQDAPSWRREGSRPVNVLPLRRPEVGPVSTGAWWDDSALAELESEFQRQGSAAGVRIPGEYRGFLFKAVLALRSQGRDVTPQALANSVARWLSPADASRIERAILEING